MVTIYKQNGHNIEKRYSCRQKDLKKRSQTWLLTAYCACKLQVSESVKLIYCKINQIKTLMYCFRYRLQVNMQVKRERIALMMQHLTILSVLHHVYCTVYVSVISSFVC